MVPHMMRFIGQITVTLAAPHRGAAAARLRSLARLVSECCDDVLFADHRGEVDTYEPVTARDSSLQLVSSRPRFDDYEIHGVALAGDDQGDYLEVVDDSEAESWRLYGHLPGHGLQPIGGFAKREQAEAVYTRITGRAYCRPGSRHARRSSAA